MTRAALVMLLATPWVSHAQTTAIEANPNCPAQGTLTPSPAIDNPLDNSAITLESGSGSLTLGGDAILEDGLYLTKDSYAIEADSGKYDTKGAALSLTGNIRYTGSGTDIRSQNAMLDYLYGEVRFTDAEFALGNGAARGAAGLLQIGKNGRIDLEQVSYTSCPPEKDDWMVRARSIRLNTSTGVGEAQGLSLRFKGVPILYTPYLSFPISAQRKTGFLLPNFGQSALNGFDISMPWYWNIDPQYDMTITPRLLTKRGVQLDNEFRYLSDKSQGSVRAAYLPGDDILNIDRTLLAWKNRTDVTDRWQANVDFTDISDNNYLEDLGGSLSSASVTHLQRSAGLSFFSEHWRVNTFARHYQTVDETLTPSQVPYKIMPSMQIRGDWPNAPANLSFAMGGELTRFDRDVGVTGGRYHLEPSMAMQIGNDALYVRPQVSWMYTRYELEQDPLSPTGTTEISRSLPIFELDSGLRLERSVSESRWTQTIEPRLYYVHVPYRDQQDIPLFDTIAPITSLEQLYRPNRFIGLDRVGDTDQLTIGITSRLIERDSGRTLLKATIGQSRYLSSQAVSLPGAPIPAGNSSDYVGELSLNFYGNWNIDFAHQYNSQRSETTRSEIRLQYRPDNRRVLNLAYRFRRDSVDQGDISWSWPLARRWNMVGRYNYSFREETTLERFIGVEYESCCWGVRLVSRRYISRRDGTADSSIAIQLELKGLTSVGDRADKLLERGILGYSRD